MRHILDAGTKREFPRPRTEIIVRCTPKAGWLPGLGGEIR